jgi:transposase-like protein
MMIMAKAYPPEFRDDVVRIARKHEAPINQIAKDFGISEATLHNWLKKADVEDGARPGLNESERSERRALKKRTRLLEQENEILRKTLLGAVGDDGALVLSTQVGVGTYH